MENYESEDARIIPFTTSGRKTTRLSGRRTGSKLRKTSHRNDSGIRSRNGGIKKDKSIRNGKKYSSEEKRLNDRRDSVFDGHNGGNIQDKSICNVKSKLEGKTTKSSAR